MRNFIDIVLSESSQDVFDLISGQTWESAEQLLIALRDGGVVPLGGGSQARVYAHGTDAVVKVYKPDAAYDAFLNYCQAHTGNAHLPQIEDRRAFASGGGIVIMERLTALSHDEFYGLEGLLNYASIVEQAEPVDTDLQIAAEFEKHHASLANVISDLVALGRYDLDMSPGNIMRRQNVIVITDPLID